VFIQKLRLQNYRCFKDKTFLFEKPFVLIEGDNGSGKTTILEALHYGCFLKSFRTNRLKDLLSFDKEHFFLAIQFEEQAGGDVNHVKVGVSIEDNEKKRLVSFNQKVVKSYKDLISHYRIVSLSEDDLQLVQGAPEVRRAFLNQLVMLFNPEFGEHFKKYRQILEQRNTMLRKTKHLSSEFEIWTKQLWEESRVIQEERVQYLSNLESRMNSLLRENFASLDFAISLDYQIKNKIDTASFEVFWKKYKGEKVEMEFRLERGLFGAHLDDFLITFHPRVKTGTAFKARYFASRGQQKLVVFLTKIALAQELETKHMRVTLLLDDFLTDFDHKRLSQCLSLLSKLSCQVIITCPLKTLITKHLEGQRDDLQVITL